MRSQTEKRKKVLCCLEAKTKISRDSSTDIRGGQNGDLLYKRKPKYTKNKVEINWIPSEFFLFFVFFFPLLFGHMLLTRFLAQEKRKSTERWRWGTGARKGAGQGGRVVKPQDYIQE